MRWTIGLPSFNNLTEVYFTVQALRMYHNLSDCEIVIIDNYGDCKLEKFCRDCSNINIRYYKYTDTVGVSVAKNKIFEYARGEYVLVMDSHVLIQPGALDFTPPDDDMIQGPIMMTNGISYYCEWKPIWRSKMWGIWGDIVKVLPKKPFEIWATGAGFFAVKKSSWLGFNSGFRGFGGETGYIQEKYRKAGRRVWCYPNMIWMHCFCGQGKALYPIRIEDRVRNYLLGFAELGLDISPIYTEFGQHLVDSVRECIK
jgi:glycosyltransferase involved in cell wall biosynthesis